MPPVYRSRCPAVVGAVGVVLVEQVIPALPEDRPVWIVQPVVRGQEMVGWAIWVGRKFQAIQVRGFLRLFRSSAHLPAWLGLRLTAAVLTLGRSQIAATMSVRPC